MELQAQKNRDNVPSATLHARSGQCGFESPFCQIGRTDEIRTRTKTPYESAAHHYACCPIESGCAFPIRTELIYLNRVADVA